MKIHSLLVINLAFLLVSCVKGAVKEQKPHKMMKERHKK